MTIAETKSIKIMPPGVCNLDGMVVVTAADRPTVFSTELEEPDTKQMMQIVECSGSLDFWDDPQEDIYTLDDGEPV